MEPVTYVLKSAGLCGGVKVVLEQASRLKQRGYDASVFYLEDSHDWFDRELDIKKFYSVNQLQLDLAKRRGIKVATWFETAYWLNSCLSSKDRGYYLVQDIEDSYATLASQKKWILDTYLLGLKPLATSKWVKQQLLEKFGQQATYVSLGIDFDKFKPIENTIRDRYRVLTQCRVWSAGPNLKGWNTAKHAIEDAFDKERSISLVTFSVEAKQNLRHDMAHMHFLNPSDSQLRGIYASSGLFLLSSNHEGFALPPAEAMAMGIPVVATKAQGNEEYCFHGKTALMAEAGDWNTLSKHIINLFHNQEYADSLAAQGHKYIKQYTWDRSIDALEHEFFQSKTSKPIASTVVDMPYALVASSQDIEYPNIEFKYKESKDVSIIIPTVNEVTLVETLIKSIKKHCNSRYGPNIEIIVIDDGTKDKQVLKELTELSNWEHFTLLTNNMNLGFSASVNRGIMEAEGKYIVLCNSDIKFIHDCITPMIELGDQDSEIGIIGPRLLYPNYTIQNAGMHKVANSLYFTRPEHNKPAYDHEAKASKPVWAITGALFVIKRKLIEELGGLSTAYSTAWEDTDYCLNAWLNNWKVFYCGDAEAIHSEGATRGATPDQKLNKPLIWSERERAGGNYFMKKWSGASPLLRPEELYVKGNTDEL